MITVSLADSKLVYLHNYFPQKEAGLPKKVVVTGISGYLGMHVAKELLSEGFAVRGTIRAASKEAGVREALASVVDTSNLEFVVVDLEKNDNWGEAVRGADTVMHVASPFILREPKDEGDYLRPAVDGTRRVLDASLTEGVRRVVITSTYLTMAGHLYSETFGPSDRTPVDDPTINAYIRSKVAAENAAWEWAKEHPETLELVTLHPGAILGPPLSLEASGTSVSTLRDLVTGRSPGIPPITVPMVDVRDVARAHYEAMVSPVAAGQRYLLCQKTSTPYTQVGQILRDAGYSKVPKRVLPKLLIRTMAPLSREVRAMKAFLGRQLIPDVSQTVKDLNWDPRSLESMVLDTARALTKE